jgi:hypothetical protein
MLTDDQLAARIGPRLRAELAALPAPDVLAALRRRRARRARAAAVLTALPVAAAAAAAAVLLPGSAAPAAPRAQDAAYVVSHVTRALGAVPAGTVFSIQSTSTVLSAAEPYSIVTDIWKRGPDVRIEAFQAGKPVSDAGTFTTGTTQTSVFVNYRDKTWWRSSAANAGDGSSGAASATSACDGVDGAAEDPGIMAAELRALVSCGALKAGGTATVGGVTTIELTSTKDGLITTWYVNSSTYLPVRMTKTSPGSSRGQEDFQWLPPTPANLAKLNLPTAPPGFTRTGA